jgi:hypothetical protein
MDHPDSPAMWLLRVSLVHSAAHIDPSTASARGPKTRPLHNNNSLGLLIMIIALTLSTLLVLGLIGFIVYAKQAQKQRIERARRLMEAKEKANRSMGALEILPKGYLKPNLRRYLVSSWYDAQKAYIEACPEPSSRELKQLEEAQDAKASFSEADISTELKQTEGANETSKQPEFTSAEQAKDVRGLLKSLHVQIKEDYSQGQLNKKQALVLLDEIKSILNNLGVDFHLSLARTAERSGDLSKALTRYRSALAAMRKAGSRIQKEQQHHQLEERIRSLHEQVHQQQRARQEATKDTLAQGIKDIDNDFTPKKQIYD